MAVAYRSSSAFPTPTDSQGSPLAVPVPSGAATDDIALLVVELNGSANPAITWPSGFTEKINVSNTDLKLKVAWKRLTGADAGNYSLTYTSGGEFRQGQCILLTGAVATGDPIEVSNTAQADGVTSVPSVSVTTATSLFLVHLASILNFRVSTAPTSYTRVQDANYLDTSYRIVGATGSQTASGGTVASNTDHLVALLAVLPATGAIDLVPVSAAQTQTSGSPALTQVHGLAVDAGVQAQTAETPTLTQIHNLSIDNAIQPQVAGAPALTQVHSLAVGAASQAQAADGVTLTQVHSLVVADALQAQATDTVTLAVGGVSLTVADATQAQTAGSVVLTQTHALSVDSVLQLQQAGQVTLSQVHTLQVASALQAQTATSVTIALTNPARDPTLVGVVESNHWTAVLEANRWTADIEPNRWEGTVPWPEL